MVSRKQKASLRSKKKNSRTARASIQRAAETRSAVAANVLWMLALMATVVAELIGAACYLYSTAIEQLPLIQMLGGVMLFIACIAGIVTLAMITLVLRISETRPPQVIIMVAIIAGALPLLTIIAKSMG